MPQPVDLQTEMARVTAAERIQQVADRASLAAQQRVADDAQAQRIQTETQVQQPPHAQSEQIDAEARRRTPFVGRRRRKKRSEEQPTKPSHGRPCGGDGEPHKLDITV